MHRVSILVGTNYINDDSGDRYQVEEAIMHPDFEMANFHNDITLLRTDKSIEFRKTDSAYKVNSVCLPPYDTEKVSFPPETAVVAGWGTTEVPSDSGSERLLKVSVSLVEHDYCKRTYSTVHNMIMSEKTLCYGRNHKDSCKGDSFQLCTGPRTWLRNALCTLTRRKQLPDFFLLDWPSSSYHPET